MTTPTIDATAWRTALPRQLRGGVDRILIVQCSLDWLRPGHQALREEIDDFVLHCCKRRTDLRVDRLVLHNLPTIQGARDGDLSQLNTAHAEWMYRLASTSVLLQHPLLHIHRLIVDGNQTHVPVDDLIDLHKRGSWLRPKPTRPVLDLLTSGKRTTPLTGYDVDLDGPFGDSDPSIYL